ncbi:MAG: glutaredoxin family protein [Thermoplasmata archaeon]
MDGTTDGGHMDDKVKVYALSTCPYCRWTKRFLSEHNVPFESTEVDLLDDVAQEEALKEIERLSGRRSFPVVVIGAEVIVGHDETKMRKALGL